MLSFMLVSFIVIISKIQASEEVQKLVCVPVAGIHAFPLSESSYESQVLHGHCVEVIHEIDVTNGAVHYEEWVRIKADDGTIGRMKKEHLAPDNIAWRTSNNLKRVCSVYAYVYESPSVKNQPIIKLPYNAYVQDGSFMQGCTTGDDECPWIKIFLADNTPGWVKKGNIESISPLSLNEMINRITKFQGLPYIHGGASPDGYDSAGFTQLIARQMGYVMSRNTHAQAHDSNLIPVNVDEMKPGDFVYFGKKDRITHAAFCIALNTIIHAAGMENHDQIMITKLDYSKLIQYLKYVRRLPKLELT